MPSTIGKCKLFRIKHITRLEGETFLRNKHEIAFFEIKCTFFGRKENTISYSLDCGEFKNTFFIFLEPFKLALFDKKNSFFFYIFTHSYRLPKYVCTYFKNPKFFRKGRD